MMIKLKNRGETHVRINYTRPPFVFPPNTVMEFEDEFYFKRDILPRLISHPFIWDVTGEPEVVETIPVEVTSSYDEPFAPVESTPPATDLSDLDKFGVDPKNLWGMSKTELQDHALRLDLDTTGLKADLVERISNHITGV